jgi:transcriptional regulator with XRE-family HTH domain
MSAATRYFVLINLLAKRRKELGITQRELGKRLGVAARTLLRWETHETDAPTMDLFRWVEALGLKVDVTDMSPEAGAMVALPRSPALDAALAAFAGMPAGSEPAPVPGAVGAAPLRFAYTNWRGERSVRRVIPTRIYFGATSYHPRPQWLMEALDVDKGVARAFAVADMRPEPLEPIDG